MKVVSHCIETHSSTRVLHIFDLNYMQGGWKTKNALLNVDNDGDMDVPGF